LERLFSLFLKIMSTTDFLTFRLREIQYGIPVTTVREIFPLPELTPVPEAPGDIIGLLNWRGKLLPVMHLDLRLGQAMQPCQLSDRVIVIDWQGFQVGMIVNQMETVLSIDETSIEDDLAYGRESHVNTAFLAGVAKTESAMVLLLNPDAILRMAEDVAVLIWESELRAEDAALSGHEGFEVSGIAENNSAGSSTLTADFYSLHCPQATVAERAIFQKRAVELKQAHALDTQTEQIPIAVVGLSGEYFGIPLDAVREFLDFERVSPIPCCPHYIVGNLNVRGEVVTLMDIKSVLNLAAGGQRADKAVIAQVGDIVTGIPIDEVFDILYLDSSEMTESSTAHRGRWTKGTAKYQNAMMSILDLPQLLRSDVFA
jgi:purine-binding chemotaxis protein CheW